MDFTCPAVFNVLQENHAHIGNQNYARVVTKKKSSQLHEEAFHDNFYLDLKFSVAFLREKYDRSLGKLKIFLEEIFLR